MNQKRRDGGNSEMSGNWRPGLAPGGYLSLSTDRRLPLFFLGISRRLCFNMAQSSRNGGGIQYETIRDIFAAGRRFIFSCVFFAARGVRACQRDGRFHGHSGANQSRVGARPAESSQQQSEAPPPAQAASLDFFRYKLKEKKRRAARALRFVFTAISLWRKFILRTRAAC